MQLTEPQREDYILVVDGSFPTPGKRADGPSAGGHPVSGAGLVLAREADEVVVAACAASFRTTSSDNAEYEAIKRGHLWAPLGTVWSDNAAAIRAANAIGYEAVYIRPHMRDPLHNLAHRLANVGRKGEWDKLDRVWLPGERWP
jgi:hypothetical protein